MDGQQFNNRKIDKQHNQFQNQNIIDLLINERCSGLTGEICKLQTDSILIWESLGLLMNDLLHYSPKYYLYTETFDVWSGRWLIRSFNEISSQESML